MDPEPQVTQLNSTNAPTVVLNEVPFILPNASTLSMATAANANQNPIPIAVMPQPAPTAPILVTVNAGAGDTSQTVSSGQVVTIPVPVAPQDDNYAYVMVKGSLHDRSCQVFGLNEEETQAISRRFENNVKAVVNGIMVAVPPAVMINTLAQLNYKVVCSTGEAEICWTMQREV